MTLLTFAARRFGVPMEHVSRDLMGRERAHILSAITFTNRQLVATYGDEEFSFDVIIRGEA